jgi:hypothetical protein
MTTNDMLLPPDLGKSPSSPSLGRPATDTNGGDYRRCLPDSHPSLLRITIPWGKTENAMNRIFGSRISNGDKISQAIFWLPQFHLAF